MVDNRTILAVDKIDSYYGEAHVLHQIELEVKLDCDKTFETIRHNVTYGCVYYSDIKHMFFEFEDELENIFDEIRCQTHIESLRHYMHMLVEFGLPQLCMQNLVEELEKLDDLTID